MLLEKIRNIVRPFVAVVLFASLTAWSAGCASSGGALESPSPEDPVWRAETVRGLYEDYRKDAEFDEYEFESWVMEETKNELREQAVVLFENRKGE